MTLSVVGYRQLQADLFIFKAAGSKVPSLIETCIVSHLVMPSVISLRQIKEPVLFLDC